MSKALVIKGANFSTNKVETVTIGETIPCTGISLSEGAISFDTLNDTETLTATLTPANTTDTLSWTSSNEDVVTVASGVVTCVGVGTATITATCGSQTATCSVTSEIVMSLSDYIGYAQFSSTDLTYNPPKDYGSLYTYANGRCYAGKTATMSGNKAFASSTSIWPTVGDYYPIMFPKGTGIIEIAVSKQCDKTGKIYVFDSTEEQTYLSRTYNNQPTAKVVQYTSGISCVDKKYTFPVSATGDSFSIQIGDSDVSQVSETITATFKPAAS